MSASKTFVNYKSPVNSFEVANERFLGVFEPGRIRGFDEIFTTTPGLVFGLSHELTGISKVQKDGTTTIGPVGVLITKQGTIAHFETPVTGLSVNANADPLPRIDVVYFQHSYQESIAPNLGVIGIQEGTPGDGIPALPVPTAMVVIGYVTVLDTTVALTTANWQPAANKTLGGFEYLSPAELDAVEEALGLRITELDNALTPVSIVNTLLANQTVKTLAANDSTVSINGSILKAGTLLSPKITGTKGTYEDYTVDPMYFYCDGALLYFERPTEFGFGNPGGTGVIFLSKGNAQDPSLPENHGCAFSTVVFETRSGQAPTDTNKEYMILTAYSFLNYQLSNVQLSRITASSWNSPYLQAAIMCTIPGKLGVIQAGRNSDNLYFRTNPADVGSGITGSFKYAVDYKANKLVFKDSSYLVATTPPSSTHTLANLNGVIGTQSKDRFVHTTRVIQGSNVYFTYKLSTSGVLSLNVTDPDSVIGSDIGLETFDELEFWLD